MAYDGGSSVRRRRRGGGGFSEMSFFTGGALGLLYKPRPATLFQDAAGATAVVVATDPAGLQLDDSRGLTLGSELISNPGPFADTTGWNAALGSIAAVSSSLVLTCATNGRAVSPALTGLTIGASYKITLAGVAGTAATKNLRVTTNSDGSTGAVFTQSISGSSITYVFQATATTLYLVLVAGGSSGDTFSISTASVKLLPGNHAFLSGTNTLRPVFQTSPQRLVFDGVDDRLLTTLNPTASGTIAVRMRGPTASKVAIGSQGATNGRAFIALAADGSLAAGIGADSTSTIKGTVDDRNAWVTGIVTWDGSTTKLYRNGTQVYSAAQNGAVNTTIPWMLGCLNNNATAASFWGGDIGAVEILNRAMTLAEVTSLTNLWSTIQ